MSNRDNLPCVIATRYKDQVGVDHVHRYALMEELGKGGMGVVYKARDLDPPEWYIRAHGQEPRVVAIKYLHRENLEMDEQIIERFIREATLVHNIQHPNVVKVLSLAPDEENQPFIVMEYVPGAQSLADLVKEANEGLADSGRISETSMKIRGSLIPYDKLFSILRQLLSALQALHEQGIVHRDLKPENLLLHEEDGDLTVKLTDFGIAKALEKSGDKAKSALGKLTQEGMLIGTPYYMAPEQIAARFHPTTKKAWVTGPWSDIWAFGAITYELVTGELAYYHDSLPLVLGMISAGEPPEHPPSHYVSRMDPVLDLLIRNCLTREPWDRLQTVEQVILMLDKAEDSIAVIEALDMEDDEAVKESIRLMAEPEVAAAMTLPKRNLKLIVGIVALCLSVGVLGTLGYKLVAPSEAVVERAMATSVPSSVSAIPEQESTSQPTDTAKPAAAVWTPVQPTPQPTASKRKPDIGPEPGSRARENYDKGLRYAAAGNCRLAEAEMNRTLAMYPAFPVPFRILSECALKQGRTAEAKKYAEQYLAFENVEPLSPALQKLLNP